MREDVKDLSEKERMEMFIFLFKKCLDLKLETLYTRHKDIAGACDGYVTMKDVINTYNSLAKDYGLVE